MSRVVSWPRAPSTRVGGAPLTIGELHDRIETGFEAWGRLMVRRRIVVIALVFGMTGWLGSWLPALRVDNSIESFLHPDDPARSRYDAFREQFGQDEALLVAVQPPEVFDLGFLARLRDFHVAIERQVPHIEEVTSLVNARNTRGEGERLVVEDLLEAWPESDADLAALRTRVLGNPFYRNWLISDDGRVTAVVVEPEVYGEDGSGAVDEALAGFEAEPAAAGEPSNSELRMLTDAETRAIVTGMKRVIADFETPEFRLYLTG
ncbi:MAG: Fis family transcriptional regulator, partial [Gaiellales bacterium]